MKNLFCLVLMTFVSFSCSNSDENETTKNVIDPTKLKKVIFYPGIQIEEHWNFYNNGLLKEITKPDETIVQNFTYDSKKRLISSTLFGDNGIDETHNFTYDKNDFVTSVDGEIVNYDSKTNSYYIGDTNQFYRTIVINSEKLLVYSKTAYMDLDVDINNGNSFEVIMDDISIGYSKINNVIYYSRNEGCNSFTYDNNKNPLRDSTLPICRAFSYIGYTRWINGLYNSANNPISAKYCLEDPESNVHQYTYNSNNLPLTQTRNDYYLGKFEASYISALYFYQGDVIPN